jgi:hypothetical protein
MFVNRRWRRRLQALLGRDMADDGPSGCQTGGTAGTPRSPTWAGTRRDAIRRRALRLAIRRRAIRHATTIPHAVPYRTRSGDGRYGTRRPFSTPCPAMGDTARDDHPRRGARRPNHTARDDHFLPGYARICPDMPGYARLYSARLNLGHSYRGDFLHTDAVKRLSIKCLALTRAEYMPGYARTMFSYSR